MSIKLPKTLSRDPFLAVTAWQLVTQLRAERDDFPTTSPEYGLLERAIGGAASWVEKYTAHIMVGAEMQISLDEFPRGELELGVYPVRELVELKYIDVNGDEQVIDPADIDQDFDAVRPKILYRDGWPVTKIAFNAVKVKIKAGYARASDIPVGMQAAVLMLAAHLHENGSATAPVNLEEVPLGVRSMADQHRMEWL